MYSCQINTKKPHSLSNLMRVRHLQRNQVMASFVNYSWICGHLKVLISAVFDDFSYTLALITRVSCITEVWLFEALSMPYQMICNTIIIVNERKQQPSVSCNFHYFQNEFFIFSLKFSLVKLLYFPKFQLRTEMRSRDIGEKVAKKTEVVYFKDP